MPRHYYVGMDLIKSESEYLDKIDELEKGGAMQLICNHIANGGTLTDLALMLKIPYPYIMRWIKCDNARKQALSEAVEERKDWYKESIYEELNYMKSMDVGDLYDDNGNPLEIQDLPKSVTKSIHSIKRRTVIRDDEEETTTELKFYDKLKAIEKLGKEADMFKDKIEHSGKVTWEQIVSESWKDSKEEQPTEETEFETNPDQGPYQ